VSMVVLASMLPVTNVINEKKKQTLPFMMSLPVSPVQYATAKLVSTVGMFLIPWLSLVAAAWLLILSRRDLPNGLVPAMLVLAMLPFVGFCLVACAALITESETWAVAATIVCNSSYGFSWYLLLRNAEVRNSFTSPKMVWAEPVLILFLAEIAVIIGILGITFYVQSRKRDFI
jgi:ABC-2 type transport system permease protein